MIGPSGPEFVKITKKVTTETWDNEASEEKVYYAKGIRFTAKDNEPKLSDKKGKYWIVSDSKYSLEVLLCAFMSTPVVGQIAKHIIKHHLVEENGVWKLSDESAKQEHVFIRESCGLVDYNRLRKRIAEHIIQNSLTNKEAKIELMVSPKKDLPSHPEEESLSGRDKKSKELYCVLVSKARKGNPGILFNVNNWDIPEYVFMRSIGKRSTCKISYKEIPQMLLSAESIIAFVGSRYYCDEVATRLRELLSNVNIRVVSETQVTTDIRDFRHYKLVVIFDSRCFARPEHYENQHPFDKANPEDYVRVWAYKRGTVLNKKDLKDLRKDVRKYYQNKEIVEYLVQLIAFQKKVIVVPYIFPSWSEASKTKAGGYVYKVKSLVQKIESEEINLMVDQRETPDTDYYLIKKIK